VLIGADGRCGISLGPYETRLLHIAYPLTFNIRSWLRICSHAASAGIRFGAGWITLAYPRFSIRMVLVCNWDDPSSADVDHMWTFCFTFTALFYPRDGWAIPASTILSALRYTLFCA
jgi:hypothetical protein